MGLSAILKVLFRDEDGQQTGLFCFVSLSWRMCFFPCCVKKKKTAAAVPAMGLLLEDNITIFFGRLYCFSLVFF